MILNYFYSYFSFYRNRKNSGLVDMKKLVAKSSLDVSKDSVERPPKRSKKVQPLGLPTPGNSPLPTPGNSPTPPSNLPTPPSNLHTSPLPIHQQPAQISPVQFTQQYYPQQSSNSVPFHQIYQSNEVISTQARPVLPGFQSIRYQNRKYCITFHPVQN